MFEQSFRKYNKTGIVLLNFLNENVLKATLQQQNFK